MKKGTTKRVATMVTAQATLSESEMNSRIAKDWILWARVNRLVIGGLSLGEGASKFEVSIASDLALAPSAPSLLSPPSRHDAYDQYAGDTRKRLEADEAADAGVIEELDE